MVDKQFAIKYVNDGTEQNLSVFLGPHFLGHAVVCFFEITEGINLDLKKQNKTKQKQSIYVFFTPNLKTLVIMIG